MRIKTEAYDNDWFTKGTCAETQFVAVIQKVLHVGAYNGSWLLWVPGHFWRLCGCYEA